MPRAAKKPGSGMTEQQEAFALECIRLGNPARAYRKVYEAGKMSQPTVWKEAYKLLDDEKIASRVQHYQEVADRAADVTVEKIARELARIAFFDPRDLFDDDGNPLPISDLSEDTARVLAGLDVEDLFDRDEDGRRLKVGTVKKYKIANKLTALEVLAKWKRMLVDRVETGAPGDFSKMSDEEVEAEAREALEIAVKQGKVKVLVHKPEGRPKARKAG